MELLIRQIKIVGYRSIRTIFFPVDQLTVLVGQNGVGKTNLYKALSLAQACARGDISAHIAQDGGLFSVLWAGARYESEPARLELEIQLSSSLDSKVAYSYEISLGSRTITEAAFPNEPLIKSEKISFAGQGRPRTIMERKGPSIWAKDDEGETHRYEHELLNTETALAGFRDTAIAPEVDHIRRTLLSWRFYHTFRTDAGSPIRHPAPAITSPMLLEDGNNLASTLATLSFIREDTVELDEIINAAFPGARLVVPEPDERATFGMVMPDFPKRLFKQDELSDGTLQFLCLVGALMSYRLPPFIALNEPETSLHPDLLPALAKLIAIASEKSQIWIVTHSKELAQHIAIESSAIPRQVVRRDDGSTWLEGLSLGGFFREE